MMFTDEELEKYFEGGNSELTRKFIHNEGCSRFAFPLCLFKKGLSESVIIFEKSEIPELRKHLSEGAKVGFVYVGSA